MALDTVAEDGTLGGAGRLWMAVEDASASRWPALLPRGRAHLQAAMFSGSPVRGPQCLSIRRLSRWCGQCQSNHAELKQKETNKT